MAKNIDLTSQEWRNLIFAGKNTEFGAYEMRKNSDKRHNKAVLFVLIFLCLVAAAIGYLTWKAEQDKQERLRIAKEQREQMMAQQLEALEEAEIEEPEEEPEVEYQEPEIEVPEEVLATVQVTQIAIVDEVKEENEVKDQTELQEIDTSFGVTNQEGQEDPDKFKAAVEEVVVKPVEEPKPEPEQIFIAVEQQAEFPGGQAQMMKWLGNNIRYPELAQQNNIEGRVIVKFVVEKDGSITNATVVKGVDKDLDREALRVVKKMPKWQPGKNNGVAVRSYFTLPVTFRLAN